MPLTLEIVTPEAKVYSDTIDSVVIPTVEGEIGVLPGHIPFLSVISAGVLAFTEAGKARVLAVGPGYVQVGSGDSVVVLTESPGLAAIAIGSHRVVAGVTQGRELAQDGVEKETEPCALTTPFAADAVHAVVPVAATHQRPAVRSVGSDA